MFDIKWIRDNPEKFDEGIGKRGLDPQAASLIALDEKRRHHLADLQDAQQRRNTISKTIGSAMAAGETDRAQKLKAEIADIKSFVQSGADRERTLDRELLNALSAIPNIPSEDVPVGEDETANVVHATWGEKPRFSHDAKEHFELGEALGMMDFSGASAISGSRFVVLRGALARLERALGQFMLDLHTAEHGYTEIAPPLIVKDEALYGTGQLPKFAEDLFRVGDDRWLIPTAEVPLTNLVRGAILAQGDLPIRYTALTPSFRSEAGSAGRDTRGMLRQHQFMKVEMVSVTDAQNGEAELERMTGCAEEVLKRLGLHYRVMTLSTGDMGFAARKTYDLEVWLPGQQAYREISSCSLCGDFQARRMNARYRRDGAKTNHFAHTLNGSGVAVGRALIAVMENYQTVDGAITVPEVLRPYMAGQSEIMVGA